MNAGQEMETVVSAGTTTFEHFAAIVLAAQQAIGNHLPIDLFADPARALLLELFIAREREGGLSVSIAAIASGAPHSTALRWIRLLEGQGLLETTEDLVDRGRTSVTLASAAHQAVANYLQSISPIPLTR